MIEIENSNELKTDIDVEIPADLESEMAGVEVNVLTGITLADALRAGVGIIPEQIQGWGSRERGHGCALTTAAAYLQDLGYA